MWRGLSPTVQYRPHRPQRPLQPALGVGRIGLEQDGAGSGALLKVSDRPRPGLQQIAIQPEPPIPESEVDTQLMELRKTIPKCGAYHCDTDAGWEKFVRDQGLTLAELRAHWKLRIEVLQFIEERFRMGIRISDQEIGDYYKKTLLPEYQKQNAQAPPEDTIKDKIQEILLQQQVDKLLEDWLATLRAQGSVRLLKPGEEAP